MYQSQYQRDQYAKHFSFVIKNIGNVFTTWWSTLSEFSHAQLVEDANLVKSYDTYRTIHELQLFMRTYCLLNIFSPNLEKPLTR